MELARVITALFFCSGHPYIVASIDQVRVCNPPIILPDERFPNSPYHYNKSANLFGVRSQHLTSGDF
jgi:hypothetical protein